MIPRVTIQQESKPKTIRAVCHQRNLRQIGTFFSIFCPSAASGIEAVEIALSSISATLSPIVAAAGATSLPASNTVGKSGKIPESARVRACVNAWTRAVVFSNRSARSLAKAFSRTRSISSGTFSLTLRGKGSGV